MQDSGHQVQLAYAHGMLGGRAGTEAVSLQITPGVVFGDVAGVIVDATWRSTSNYLLPPNEPVEAEANGAFGHEELYLTGRFYLGRQLVVKDSDADVDSARSRFNRFFPLLFREGSVEGRVGDRHVTVEVAAASGGLSSSTVRAQGSWGEVAVALHGTVGISLDDEGWVRGQVGDSTVNLRVGSADDGLTIDGEFSGPIDLLIALIACLLKFLGAMWRD
jgi:hypothetical protein